MVLRGENMTKNFKKSRNFDSLCLMSAIEREIIEEKDSDIFTLTPAERGNEEFDEEFISSGVEA
jgi:hypothetical protein